ncbi:MAG: regulatory protein RecX [Atopobiaceae bacterium]|jgi:regulatory protein
MADATSDFTWDIELPSQSRAALGSAKPQARIWFEDASGRHWTKVPLCVAKELNRTIKTEGFSPSSASELEDAINGLEEAMTWSRVVDIASRREISVSEVRDRLKRDGFDSFYVDQALKRAISCSLLDDARYADVYIRSKISAGWGQRRIERELTSRRIDCYELAGWPYAYFDADEEYERAVEIAARKHVSDKNAFPKLVRFLMNRGFGMDVAKRAAQRVLEENSY